MCSRSNNLYLLRLQARLTWDSHELKIGARHICQPLVTCSSGVKRILEKEGEWGGARGNGEGVQCCTSLTELNDKVNEMYNVSKVACVKQCVYTKTVCNHME